MITRQEAKARGITRYFGKVCEKHPELNGERRTSNWSCVRCARVASDKNKSHRMKTDNKYLTKERARLVIQQIKRRQKDPIYKAKQNKLVHKRYRERYAVDPLFNLKQRVRRRLLSVLRGERKSTEQIIGCSWEELKRHIEKQFTSGMSWSNRGLWHVDHIVPLARAETSEDVYKLNHFTNLQPLWAADNLTKGAA